MNKAETGIHTPAELDLREVRSEQLSALADGQLHGDEFAAALAWAADDDGREVAAAIRPAQQILAGDLVLGVGPEGIAERR